MPWINEKMAESKTETLPSDRRNDAIFTIDELIRRRAFELKDLPLLGYPREGLTDHEEHSAQAVDKYVDAAVEKLQQRGLKPAVRIIEIRKRRPLTHCPGSSIG